MRFAFIPALILCVLVAGCNKKSPEKTSNDGKTGAANKKGGTKKGRESHNPLTAYKDKNPVFVTFVDKRTDPRYATFIGTLPAAKAKQPDLVTIEVFDISRATSTGGVRDGGPLTARQVSELRDIYGGSASNFTVVLIGKDGKMAAKETSPKDATEMLEKLK